MPSDYDPTITPLSAPLWNPDIPRYEGYDPLEGITPLDAQKVFGQTLKKLSAATATYAKKIAVYRAVERDLARLKAERLELEKRLQSLEGLTDPTVEAWCADRTETLAPDAVAGTIETPGDYRGEGWVHVAPGHDTMAAWSSSVYGRLQFAIPLSECGFAWNLTMLAPVQKWWARWRYAEMAAAHPNNLVDLAFDDLTAQPMLEPDLDINPTAHHYDVPVRYMDCHHAAFAVGDRVLVEFLNGQGKGSWDTPTVIGFYDRPRRCRALLYFDAGPVVYAPDGDLSYYSLLNCRIRWVTVAGAVEAATVVSNMTYRSLGAAAADSSRAYVLAQAAELTPENLTEVRVMRAQMHFDPPVVSPVGTWWMETGFSLPLLAADRYFLYFTQQHTAYREDGKYARWGVYRQTDAGQLWLSEGMECRAVSCIGAWDRWVALVQGYIFGNDAHALDAYETDADIGMPLLRWSIIYIGATDRPYRVAVGEDCIYAALPGFRIRVFQRSTGAVLDTLDLSPFLSIPEAKSGIVGIVPYSGAVYVGIAVSDNSTPRPLVCCQRAVTRDETGLLLTEALSYLETLYPADSSEWLPVSLGG